MKNFAKIICHLALPLLALTLVFTGCSDIFSPPAIEKNAGAGGLTITVANNVNTARTLVPTNVEFSSYELTFTGPSGAYDPGTLVWDGNTTQLVQLEEGLWTISAKGFVTTGTGEYEAASGSAEITIDYAEDPEPGLIINLETGIDASKKGYFSYSLDYPQDKGITAAVQFGAFPSGTPASIAAATQHEFNSGYYLFTITLSNDYQIAARTEIVHIYPGLLTEADYTFDTNDFVNFITLGGTAAITVGTTAATNLSVEARTSATSNAIGTLIGKTAVNSGNWSMNVAPFDETTVYFWVYENNTKVLYIHTETAITGTKQGINIVYTVAEPDPLEGKLLILQAYGSSDTANGASHSFVELYNTTNADINLSDYVLWYADGIRGTDAREAGVDDEWNSLTLTGTIPAETSFLVLGKKQNTNATGSNAPRYIFPDNSGDINDDDFTLSNRAFKVVLIHGTTTQLDASIQNPFNVSGTKVTGYIDMVGSANDLTNSNPDNIFGYETSPARNSASAAVRRATLVDTDNNSVDFASIDYRVWSASNPDRTTDEQLEIYRPKSTAYGAWDPETGARKAVYTVSLGSATNGSIDIAPTGLVAAGTEITLTVEADSGYYLEPDSLTVSGSGGAVIVTEHDTETYHFTMPAYDVTVDAVFTAIPIGEYLISIVVSEGGDVKADFVYAAEDETITLTITAEPNYELDTLTVSGSGGDVTPTEQDSTTWYFTMPDYAVTVTATFVSTVPAPPAAGENTLLILQVGAGSSNATNPISHSFVELYNAGETAVSLKGYSLQYAAGTTVTTGDDGAWTKIDFDDDVVIQPSHSFLILGNKVTEYASPNLNLASSNPDVTGSFTLDNNALKVALMRTTTLLTVQNPFDTDGSGTKAIGYVDMLGAINSGNGGVIRGYETEYVSGLTRQMGVRRTSLTDSDNNADDFECITYGTASNVELYGPKNHTYGAWDPFEEPAAPEPADYSTLVLNEVSGNNKYVEIYNSGDEAVSLYGVKLQRNDGASEWTGGTTDSIPGKTYRLFQFNGATGWDPATNSAYVGWTVDSGISSGQILKVALVDPSGNPIDVFIRGDTPLPSWGTSTSVTQDSTNTYSRMDDGTWAYAAATPGAANGTKVAEIVSPGYLTAQP